jgi:hypothetical protein
MSTTPPDPPPFGERDPDRPSYTEPGASSTGTTGTTAGPSWFASMPSDARLPIPGNAEFALYLAALVLAALVCLIADRLDSGAWLDFFKWTTIAYLLSRGIAKASRVLEQ